MHQNFGRAYAGMGVDGTDVSGLYYNPATMTLHTGTQAQFGFVGVGLNLDYNSKKGDSIHDENGRKHPEAVPNLFISHQINDVTWIGFGFTVPFGLSTEYGENWEQSGEGTEAKIAVYDFNPSFAWKLSDKVSLGAGISYQYVKADLGFNWTHHPLLGKGTPGMAYTKVSGDAWGWNVGLMWTPVESVRIGASYRSAVGHTVNGTLNTDNNIKVPVGGNIVALPTSMNAQVSMDAPAWAMLSAAWDVNDWLSLYGTMRWADWSSFKSLTIETQHQDFESKKNWKDTYLYSFIFTSSKLCPSATAPASTASGRCAAASPTKRPRSTTSTRVPARFPTPTAGGSPSAPPSTGRRTSRRTWASLTCTACMNAASTTPSMRKSASSASLMPTSSASRVSTASKV